MGGTDSSVSAPSISTYGKSRFFFFSHQGRSLQTPPSLLFINVTVLLSPHNIQTVIDLKSFNLTRFNGMKPIILIR